MGDLFIIVPSNHVMYWIDDFFLSFFFRQKAAQNS